MLSAFTAQPLVELRPRDKSKIESLLAYGDRLLVGLNTGSLRIYRVNEINDDEDGLEDAEDAGEHVDGGTPSTPVKAKPTDLLREEENFARYKIEQLAIIKEANVLVSLSGGYVSLHDWQTYQLQEQLVRTKGASTFTVTSNIVKDKSTGVPSIVSRLAVAVKRKVMLWTWRDMELEEDTGEITLVSGIKTLTWATGTKLLAGLNSSYLLVDIESKKLTDIIGPGSIGGSGGSERGGLGMTSMSYIGIGGAAPKPLATRLSEGEMLLAKDVNTHFIDTDGNSLGRGQIPWSAAPEAVGYSYPYLLTLQDPSNGTLEVRNPETLYLLQSISLPSASIMHIPQPNISLAHAGKGFLVAGERIIWRMNALDYDSQIESLVEEGHFDEAISLLGMLEDALLTDKLGRLREVKLQKAQDLFDNRKYRASLDLFTEVSAPPELVIRLYPKIIAGDLSTVVEDEYQSESEGNAEESSDRANGSKPNGVVAIAEDKNKGKGVGYTPSVRSLLKYKTEDGASETSSVWGVSGDKDSNGADKPLQGKDLKAAVYELQGFLADIRRRLQRFLNPDGSVKVSDLCVNGESDEFSKSVISILGISENDEDVDIGKRLRETASLVDTTLFRAHMYATPSLAGSLFRIANFCDPDVVMEKLEETGRYNELIDFLFGKKLHRPALEHLQKFGQAEKEEKSAPQLLGPKRTITYLQNLPSEMVNLILEFAEWPLRTDPGLGMEIFLADTENAETLPRDKVLDFLQGIDPKLAIRYLEHVIEELNDMTPDLHYRLLLLYLERLKNGKEGEEAAEFQDEEERGDCKGKFLDMLKSSSQYSPAKMLDRLPRDDPEFFEARAIVFSKMGQHRQALEIYVFRLNHPQKAESYCNQIYLAKDTHANVPDKLHKVSPTDHDENHPSIYHTLLSLYLSPPHGYKPQYGPAVEILAKHGSRLPASSTLDLIPESFPIHELEFYFRGRIRAENSVVNESRIVAALRKVQSINSEADLLIGDGLLGGNRGRNRFVTVTEERMCGVCHKRLGGSVISVFPDNTVVHLGCVNRRSPGV
ncbi:AvaB protein, putative [Coccidioides posadasii C735 delta SOWgp]|uniref:AvaB protein, putative n=1 Tax=Coccidioides posadasii (strain C735) TaxID=222929 RepID=C5PC20_COCP7|nr:AvaB protein, putative [Coccidioides posadasii C735 delta SOWgp]EER25497.1 AvaB protein, putative [Coccidioides posadasii C735 delta SOWgp]|eukprot:XP_003067642.1 AvaB protein, putative [Coccidioides posadasii C735 delta SOWgp]